MRINTIVLRGNREKNWSWVNLVAVVRDTYITRKIGMVSLSKKRKKTSWKKGCKFKLVRSIAPYRWTAHNRQLVSLVCPRVKKRPVSLDLDRPVSPADAARRRFLQRACIWVFPFFHLWLLSILLQKDGEILFFDDLRFCSREFEIRCEKCPTFK